jgi:hypothetical protein
MSLTGCDFESDMGLLASETVLQHTFELSTIFEIGRCSTFGGFYEIRLSVPGEFSGAEKMEIKRKKSNSQTKHFHR